MLRRYPELGKAPPPFPVIAVGLIHDLMPVRYTASEQGEVCKEVMRPSITQSSYVHNIYGRVGSTVRSRRSDHDVLEAWTMSYRVRAILMTIANITVRNPFLALLTKNPAFASVGLLIILCHRQRCRWYKRTPNLRSC